MLIAGLLAAAGIAGALGLVVYDLGAGAERDAPALQRAVEFLGAYLIILTMAALVVLAFAMEAG